MPEDNRSISQEEKDKFLAEAEEHRALARKAAAEAALVEIQLERERRKEQDALTEDRWHHRYVLDSVINEGSVKACMRQLDIWERQTDRPLTVTLVLNSPGGGIFPGFALIDYIEAMKSRGHVINTHAIGMAASMAGVILQVGNERSMGPSAFLLIHEAQFNAGGSFGDVEDTVKLVRMMQKRILHIFASRANISAKTIARRWNRKDWWIPADEALKYGFIDKIGA